MKELHDVLALSGLSKYAYLVNSAGFIILTLEQFDVIQSLLPHHHHCDHIGHEFEGLLRAIRIVRRNTQDKGGMTSGIYKGS